MEEIVPTISRLPLVIAVLAIAFASTFVSAAGAQEKCSDADIVGSGTGKARGDAFIAADLAWEKEASAKLGEKTVYHAEPRTKCSAKKGEYTCTVSAKACTSAPERQRSARRSSCHVSASGCEICCYNPTSGGTDCHPQCK
jgi:hypothetical protein